MDDGAFANVLLGFNLALEPFDMCDVDAAFKDWLKESSKMPRPADIRERAEANKKFRAVRAGRTSAVPSTPRPREKEPVILDPWVYKHWDIAHEDGSVQAFFDKWTQVPTLEERERMGFQWLRYACDFLGYPRWILQKFRIAAGLAISENPAL